MNSHVDPIVTPSRLIRWPSAATCAFLASGLQVLLFVLSQLASGWGRLLLDGSTYAGLVVVELFFVLFELIFVFGVAVEATALWGVSRRQRTVAPLSAPLGQWVVATHVVMKVSLFVLTVLMSVGGFVTLPTVSSHIGQSHLTSGSFLWQTIGSSMP